MELHLCGEASPRVGLMVSWAGGTYDVLPPAGLDQAREIVLELHRCGVVHGDVACSNMGFEPTSGRVALFDFSEGGTRATFDDEAAFESACEDDLERLDEETRFVRPCHGLACPATRTFPLARDAGHVIDDDSEAAFESAWPALAPSGQSRPDSPPERSASPPDVPILRAYPLSLSLALWDDGLAGHGMAWQAMAWLGRPWHGLACPATMTFPLYKKRPVSLCTATWPSGAAPPPPPPPFSGQGVRVQSIVGVTLPLSLSPALRPPPPPSSPPTGCARAVHCGGHLTSPLAPLPFLLPPSRRACGCSASWGAPSSGGTSRASDSEGGGGGN